MIIIFVSYVFIKCVYIYITYIYIYIWNIYHDLEIYRPNTGKKKTSTPLGNPPSLLLVSRLPSLIFQCLRKSCTPEADTASCCTLEPPDLNGASVVFGSHSDRKRRGRISGPTPIRLRCVCFFCLESKWHKLYFFVGFKKLESILDFGHGNQGSKLLIFFAAKISPAVLSIHRTAIPDRQRHPLERGL